MYLFFVILNTNANNLATMTIKIFSAITRLFAIAVNKQRESNEEIMHATFEEYLHQNIEDKYIPEFLDLFKKSLLEYSSLNSAKKLSLNSVRLLKACNSIVNELSEYDSKLVFYSLYVLITRAGNLSNSISFLEVIAQIFRIDHATFKCIIEFHEDSNLVDSFSITENKATLAYYISIDQDVVLLEVVRNNSLNINNIYADVGIYLLDKNSVVSTSTGLKYYLGDFEKDKFSSHEDRFKLYINALSLTIKNKQILKSVSFEAQSGELIGILGKSGSGKTSLLRGISIDLQEGGSKTILAQGSKTNEPIVTYLNQENEFIPYFTVLEHLEQRVEFLQTNKSIVNKVLSSVQLDKDSAKIAIRSNNRNGDLSGGQKKRLSIALDLLANPDIMLLDEPTSGLASNDSFQLVNLLKSISSQNKIVLATIHQPDFDSFMLFDKILIIDEGGYSIYFGRPDLASDYFRNEVEFIDKASMLENDRNPGVIFNQIEDSVYDIKLQKEKRRVLPEEWYEMYLRTIQPKNRTEPRGSEKKKNERNFSIVSIWNYLKFNFKIDIKNRARFILLMLIPLMIGVSFSFLSRYSLGSEYSYFYNPNIAQWLLLMIITSMFIGLVNSGHEFILLRKYHQSENYIINRRQSFFLSKIIKYGIVSVIQTLLIVVPSIIILELRINVVNLFVVLWLINNLGSLLGLVISYVFKNLTTVYLIIPLLIIPQLLLSGSIIKFSEFNKTLSKDGNVPIVARMSPTYIAMEALILDFALYSDFQTNQYHSKVLFFEAVYYTDYFLPALDDFSNDEALVVLKSEIEQNTNFPRIENLILEDAIPNISLYYTSQEREATKELDRINDSLYDSKYEVALYNNKQIIEWIDYLSANKPIIIKSNSISRNFQNLYIPSYYNSGDKLQFSGVSKFYGISFQAHLFYIYLLLFANCLIAFFLVVFSFFRTNK